MKWDVVVTIGYCKMNVVFEDIAEAGEFAKTVLMRGVTDRSDGISVSIEIEGGED